MKTPFKVAGASVLALSLAFCGCSKRTSFEPMAGRDAEFALGVNLDKKQALAALDASVDQVLGLLACDDTEIAEIKRDFFCKWERERKFLDESGLRDAELRWAVLSVDRIGNRKECRCGTCRQKCEEGCGPEGMSERLDGLSLAVAGKIDLDKLVHAFEKCFYNHHERSGTSVLTEVTVEGERAWHIEPPDFLYGEGLDPYVTSLDGELLLVAMSRNALERQIRLYRKKKKGKDDAMSGFSAAEGELLRLHISDIGGLARRNLASSDIRQIRESVMNGDKILLGLRNLDVDVKVSSDGKLSESFRLDTASEKDAESLRIQAKMKLMTAVDQMEKAPTKATKAWKEKIDDVKIGGTGAQVEVQSSSCTAMAAALLLKPVVAGMSLKANTPSSIAKPAGPAEKSGDSPRKEPGTN